MLHECFPHNTHGITWNLANKQKQINISHAYVRAHTHICTEKTLIDPISKHHPLGSGGFTHKNP